jgi:hypothetical protein
MVSESKLSTTIDRFYDEGSREGCCSCCVLQSKGRELKLGTDRHMTSQHLLYCFLHGKICSNERSGVEVRYRQNHESFVFSCKYISFF